MRVTVHLSRYEHPLVIEGVHVDIFDGAMSGLRQSKPFLLLNHASEFLLVRRDLMSHAVTENESDQSLQRIAKANRSKELGAAQKISAKVQLSWMGGSQLFAWKVEEAEALVSSFLDGGHARKDPLRCVDTVTQRALYLPDRSCVCWIKTETLLDEHKS